MVVAATCIYLAGKVEEDHIRLRDIINVFTTLTPGNEPLESNEAYWALRDSIVQCELLLLRVLKFHVNNDHPHRYLLDYLKSLTDWMQASSQEELVSLARTCWSLLTDFYTNKKCIVYKPQEVAMSVLQLAFKLHELDTAYSLETIAGWFQELCDDDIPTERSNEIKKDLMLTYKNYLEVPNSNASL